MCFVMHIAAPLMGSSYAEIKDHQIPSNIPVKLHFSTVYILVNVQLLYQMNDEDEMAVLQHLNLVKKWLWNQFQGGIISVECETDAKRYACS